MRDRLSKMLRENPPTIGEAAIAFMLALIAWGADWATAHAPAYVVWAGAALAAVVAIGVVGRVVQRFTLPTDWLDAEAVLDLVDKDRGDGA